MNSWNYILPRQDKKKEQNLVSLIYTYVPPSNAAQTTSVTLDYAKKIISNNETLSKQLRSVR